MSNLRDKLTEAFIETITNTVDGAGSDLSFAFWEGDEWIELSGNLDVQHLVSVALQVIEAKND